MFTPGPNPWRPMLEGWTTSPGDEPSPLVMGPWIHALNASEGHFLVDSSKAGLDFAERKPGSGAIERCRIKVFEPDPGVGLAMAYKDSRLTHSLDRFAYGFLVARRRPFDSSDISSMLAYLRSGFHPERRPEALKRALPYTVPR